MATVNLASKYSKKVSERLKKGTVIGGLTNKNYDFIDVNTVKLYSVGTFAMNNYARAGENRYGNPEEITTSLQTWTLAQDRSFTGTVDKLNDSQSMGVLKPGSILARQLREVVVPEIDTYILQVMATAANVAGQDVLVTPGATISSNAYTNFLTLRGNIIDNEGKEDGLKAVMTAAYYNMLKQSGFVLASNIAQQGRQSGDLGLIDNTPARIAPSSRMPANTDLIIVHPEVTTFANVLTDYNTNTKPQGISGVLLEGRVSYDGFVDVNKLHELVTHRTA